jgi:tRNA threonylcarbamoyladenosine modification (KEOPS) complex  Pcc1 subunit
MKDKATVRIEFPSSRDLETIFEAMAPEIKRPINLRSRVNATKEGKTLILEIEAKDTVAMRSAVNSYLRWINSTNNVLRTLETY